MKELSIGVIGSGGRGAVARELHNNEKLGTKIVACCDKNESTLETNKEWYGSSVFTTTDYKKLLALKPDAVFVCTPDFMHEEHVLAALNAGIPVYLEKPMAITIQGCDKILKKVKDTGVKLFVGHNMRYMNIMQKMKQMVDKGMVGTVKSIWCRHFVSYGGDAYFRDWHSERKNTTGLLLQKGVHDIDMIHWFSGKYTKRVSAFGALSVYGDLPRRKSDKVPTVSFDQANYPPSALSGFSQVIDVEDQNAVIMDMGDGVICSYLQCHFAPDACRNYTIIGTEGKLENIGDGPEDPIFLWNKRKDRYRMIGDEVFYGDSIKAGSHGGSDNNIVSDFIDMIRNNVKTIATPEAARMAVAVGCQATASLRNNGQPMDIPEIKID